MSIFKRHKNDKHSDNIEDFDEFEDYSEDESNAEGEFASQEEANSPDDFDNPECFGINPNDPLTDFYPGAERLEIIEDDTYELEIEEIEESFEDADTDNELSYDVLALDNGIVLSMRDLCVQEEEQQVDSGPKEDLPIIYCIDNGHGIFAGETKILGPLESAFISAYQYDDDSEQETTYIESEKVSKNKSGEFADEWKEGHIIASVTDDGAITSDKPKSKFKLIQKTRVVFEGDNVAVAQRFKWTNIKDIILLIVALLIICGLGWYVYDYFNQNNQAEEEFNDVGNVYTLPEMVSVEEQKPDTTTSWPPIVDWTMLKAQYPDVAAWLRIPGTSVDYPVLTNSEADYYLHRSMSGAYSMPGSIFCDFENTNDLSQEHIVIYGHHMIYPSMFHDVANYKNKDFFDAHRVVYFETPQTTYVLRPIGMYYISPEEYEVRTVLFKDSQNFQAYLDARLARADSIKYEDYNRSTLDKLFTLITCSDDGKARQIVECVVEQTYPTSMIPSVIARGEADLAAELNQ